MLHIDYTNLKINNPSLTPAWEAFERWQVQNCARQYLDVREVFALDSDISARIILEAVEILLESGTVRQVYKVLHPVYKVIGPDFNSPLEVPHEVRNRFDQLVSTDEAEIVPLLREA